MATIETSNIGHTLKRRYSKEKPQSLTRRGARVWMAALNKKIGKARKKFKL